MALDHEAAKILSMILFFYQCFALHQHHYYHYLYDGQWVLELHHYLDIYIIIWFKVLMNMSVNIKEEEAEYWPMLKYILNWWSVVSFDLIHQRVNHIIFNYIFYKDILCKFTHLHCIFRKLKLKIFLSIRFLLVSI